MWTPTEKPPLAKRFRPVAWLAGGLLVAAVVLDSLGKSALFGDLRALRAIATYFGFAGVCGLSVIALAQLMGADKDPPNSN
jgi:hypothetical protein